MVFFHPGRTDAGIRLDYSPALFVSPRNTDSNTSKNQYIGYKYPPYPAKESLILV